MVQKMLGSFDLDGKTVNVKRLRAIEDADVLHHRRLQAKNIEGEGDPRVTIKELISMLAIQTDLPRAEIEDLESHQVLKLSEEVKRIQTETAGKPWATRLQLLQTVVRLSGLSQADVEDMDAAALEGLAPGTRGN